MPAAVPPVDGRHTDQLFILRFHAGEVLLLLEHFDAAIKRSCRFRIQPHGLFVVGKGRGIVFLFLEDITPVEISPAVPGVEGDNFSCVGNCQIELFVVLICKCSIGKRVYRIGF